MNNKMVVKPNKRNEALLTFSREHHYGLLLVWKIREGIRKGIAPKRIANFVLFFFEHDLKQHFNAEETFLFPKLDNDSPMFQRAWQEHQAIRSLIDHIDADKQNLDLLHEFSTLLEAHIRFEERTLFNDLQDTLSATELHELAKHHQLDVCDRSEKWNDKFWERKNVVLE